MTPQQPPDGAGATARTDGRSIIVSSSQRQILFNAFDMNCVGHQSPGLWRHPQDHSRDYNKLSYWTDLAQTLEKGLFDGLFIADVLGPYDVYGGNANAALTSGAQVPVNDPFLLDRKSTRLNSSHVATSYAVFCLKKKRNYAYSNN